MGRTKHPTKVIRMHLRHNRGFAEWVARINHTTRYVYNRAVDEYLFGGEYLDRVVVEQLAKPFKIPAKGKVALGNLYEVEYVYDTAPSEYALKYGMMKELTKWRAELDYVRDCPAAYGRGAIMDASVAARRVIKENFQQQPYRRMVVTSASYCTR